MYKYRYSVITCNFGGYEIMREINNPLDDVEYLYITDDRSITSNTWNVIYDFSYKNYIKEFDKVVAFRQRVLDYCNTSICIRIDASIKIDGYSFENTIEEMNKNNSDIAFIISPRFFSYENELQTWEMQRGIDKDVLMDFTRYCDFKKFDYHTDINNICTLGILFQRNNKINRLLNLKQFEVLEEIKKFNNRDVYYRVDQIIFTYVLNEFFRGIINVFPLHYDIISNSFTQIYFHNTKQELYDYNISNGRRLYIFNEVIEKLYNGFKYYNLINKEYIVNNSKKIHFNFPEYFYSDKTQYNNIVKTYSEWLKRDDVIKYDIFNGYYYNTSNYERYLVNEEYYKYLEPICKILDINLNIDDFNEFVYGSIKVFLPKKIIDNICFIPKVFKREDGYYEVEYHTGCSFFKENSLSLATFKHRENNVKLLDYTSDYTKQFKYSLGSFKLQQNRVKKQGDRSLLIITDGTVIPFIHILNHYFYTIIVIDNYFNNLTYEFLYAYNDITDILILTSTNKPCNLIIDNI